MPIHLASVLVDDQAKALAFYTDALGFLPKADVDMGGSTLADGRFVRSARWHRAGARAGCTSGGRTVQASAGRRWDRVHLVRGGRLRGRVQRLLARGVVFTQPRGAMGPITTAALDDTWGNLVQIASMNA